MGGAKAANKFAEEMIFCISWPRLFMHQVHEGFDLTRHLCGFLWVVRYYDELVDTR